MNTLSPEWKSVKIGRRESHSTDVSRTRAANDGIGDSSRGRLHLTGDAPNRFDQN